MIFDYAEFVVDSLLAAFSIIVLSSN